MANKKKKSKKTRKNQNKNKTTSKTHNYLKTSPPNTTNDFLKTLGPKGYLHLSNIINKDINIEDYSMKTPDGLTLLLNKSKIKLTYGKKYGLVGKNGCGKTTLLRNMASYKIEKFPKFIRMMHIEQEINDTEKDKVIDAVLKADIIRTQLLNEEKRLEELIYTIDEDLISSTQESLDLVIKYMEDLDIRESNKKAYKILTGLGFTKEMQNVRVNSLSGGWRMRVQLAKALFVSPDLLLLDEPTNHLDFPAVLWLEQYLKNDFKKTLIVVSHDRTFLNSVITNIIHIEIINSTLTYYKGNYDSFKLQQEDNFKTLMNLYRSYEVQINGLKEFIIKFKDAGEKRAAQVQSKIKTLKKLEKNRVEKPREIKCFSFRFPEPDRIEQCVSSLDDVSFGYVKGKVILRNVNVSVDMDSKVGVIGANGVGKSTLVKLLMGDLLPLEGSINKNRSFRIAYFSQHHYDQLDLSTSAIEYLLNKFKKDLEETKDKTQFIRKHLARFGIKGDKQNCKMQLLSGGQKSRVAFAVLTFTYPHFIIMDEPTNHLDIETIEALINAISLFEGGILLISHDQYFLSKVVNEFWSVTPEKIVRFENFEIAKKYALKNRIDEVHYF